MVRPRNLVLIEFYYKIETQLLIIKMILTKKNNNFNIK